ncbi:MAG: 30S ribosomal protein S3 [Candidatus Marinimicrobia bacterium]|nr:30S ribosomal protein S3 [Candidatus Neomarinimicrobiota bacterium]
MGQKANPIGLRLGINRGWDSTWFDEKHYADRLKEDIILRRYIQKKYKTASVSRVLISRTSTKVSITINTARPGLIIGKSGSEVDSLKKELNKLVGHEVSVNVFEIKRPALVASLVGDNISQQIEKKVNYRRAVKKSIQSTISMGANGIRVRIAGRLNGAEIARQETFKEGRVPLHTLRAKIDYAHVEANTTYGIIGIKVWIYND